MIADVINAIKDQVLNNFDSPSSIPAWTQQQWHEAFSFLFLEYKQRPKHMEHNDDLIFFVHSDQQALYRHHGSADPKADLDKGPFSVRRRGQQLSSDWGLSGKMFSAFAWDKTLLLNLILQAHYALTVITCR